jgi:hypothetical protein
MYLAIRDLSTRQCGKYGPSKKNGPDAEPEPSHISDHPTFYRSDGQLTVLTRLACAPEGFGEPM